MTEDFICIITRAYQSANYIERLYNSLIAQTDKSFEWVIVDDCSTDETIRKLLELKKLGAIPMKIYRLPFNTGGSTAVSVSVIKSTGDIIIKVDHDDELMEDAIEKIRYFFSIQTRNLKLLGFYFLAFSPQAHKLLI